MCHSSDLNMATMTKMMGDSVRRIVKDILASPRAFAIGAPIEGRERTAMIGAAEDFPCAQGAFTSPAGTRITIAARGSFPRPPEPSTPAKDAAREGGAGPQTRFITFGRPAAPSAIDTEVVLTEIQVVDDPRDSGAMKLGPGVFVGAAGRNLAGPGQERIDN